MPLQGDAARLTRRTQRRGSLHAVTAPSRHGDTHAQLITWLTLDAAATPSVMTLDNARVILGDDSEPQPDACLLVRPDHGGQIRLVDGNVQGALELVEEVALSSASYDLHSNFDDYERAGVSEYVVVKLHDREVIWFAREADSLTRHGPGEDGRFAFRDSGSMPMRYMRAIPGVVAPWLMRESLRQDTRDSSNHDLTVARKAPCLPRQRARSAVDPCSIACACGHGSPHP